MEIERLRYGMQARERERTRWAREIHDESIQGIGALRLQLANARDQSQLDALVLAECFARISPVRSASAPRR